jgi:hypothetical protein
MESEPDPAPDLGWLALCYVAGEMGRDEAEAFECRLDQDQSAREALAEVVALAGAIARLDPEPRSVLTLPLSTRRRGRTGMIVRVLAAGFAAAACLTWLLAGPGGPLPKAPAPEIAKAETGAEPEAASTTTINPSDSLPIAWSKLRFESPGAREDDPGGELLAWNDEPPALPEVELPMPDEAEAASDPALPLWLLDAASLAGRLDPDVDGDSAQEH